MLSVSRNCFASVAIFSTFRSEELIRNRVKIFDTNSIYTDTGMASEWQTVGLYVTRPAQSI